MGEGREKEKYRGKEEEEARSSLSLRRAGGKSRNGGSLSHKGALHPCSEVEVIGP